MYVSDIAFEKQMAYLRKEYRIVSLPEMLGLWDGGDWDAQVRYCVITFDDGWVDTYQYAFPILRSHGVPATVFLPTDRIGTATWFWPDRLGHLLMRLASARPDVRRNVRSVLVERWGLTVVPRSGRWLDATDRIIEHCKSLAPAIVDDIIDAMSRQAGLSTPTDRRLLTWDEVEAMGRQGISFGSHSATHRLLPSLDPVELRLELETSLETLRARSINAIPVLAYPNGDYNEGVAEAARRAGYGAAFTTKPGAEGPRPGDRFALRRIGVHEDVTSTVPLFAFHLARRGQVTV